MDLPVDLFEFEFRDGKRQVPTHLAPFLRKLDEADELYKITYQQAIDRVNEGFTRNLLDAQSDKIRSAPRSRWW